MFRCLTKSSRRKSNMGRHQPKPDELKKRLRGGNETISRSEVAKPPPLQQARLRKDWLRKWKLHRLCKRSRNFFLPPKQTRPQHSKCEKRLLELKLKLDEAADALEWPALVAESRDWLGWLQNIADQHGNSQQKQKAEDLAAEVEEIIRDHKPDRLRKRIEQIARLYYEIVMAQPGWWVDQFQKMEKQQQEMSDQARAGRFLGQGRDCLGKKQCHWLAERRQATLGIAARRES